VLALATAGAANASKRDEVRRLGDLIVWVIWHYVKNNFKGNARHHLLEDSQMPLGINAAAKASDNDGTHIGEGANDAPGMQPL